MPPYRHPPFPPGFRTVSVRAVLPAASLSPGRNGDTTAEAVARLAEEERVTKILHILMFLATLGFF